MTILLALSLFICQIQGPTAPVHENPKGMNGDKQR